MKENENRPARTLPMQGDLFHKASWNNKDKSKLSKRQQKVADLLKTGKHSAADISIALHYSDPRSYIRELRGKGINVLDEWVGNDDCRYKRYWIETAGYE